jgi:mono/diheme cytochrome c family protein
MESKSDEMRSKENVSIDVNIDGNVRRILRVSAILILLVVLATIIAIPVIPVASADSEDSEDSGKEIYEKKCLMCHGEKGDGQKMNGVDFSNKEFWAKETDEELIDAIKNGKGNMPAFSDLSDKEISEVLEYIRSFAGTGSGVTETPTPRVTPKKTETPEKIVTEKKSPGFEVTMVVFALAGVGLLDIFRKNRKRI